MKLRNDCDQIVRRAIAAVQPDAAVRRALEGNPFQGGRVVLVAVGKAAWSMALSLIHISLAMSPAGMRPTERISVSHSTRSSVPGMGRRRSSTWETVTASRRARP